MSTEKYKKREKKKVSNKSNLLMITISWQRNCDPELSYSLTVKGIEKDIQRNLRIYPLEYAK